MKGQIAQAKRRNLIDRLQTHERGALRRLAHAVRDRDSRVDTLNYSRMHHKHNKSLANVSFILD